MECEEVRSQFPEYLKEAVPEAQRAVVLAHLTECPSCRNELATLGTVWAGLSRLPMVEPGPQVRQRFDHMIETYHEGINAVPESLWSRVNGWLRQVMPEQPALQLAAGLLLLVGGVWAGRAWAPAPEATTTPAELATLREEVHTMRQMVAMSLLQQQSAVERLRGISWTSQIDSPDSQMLRTLVDTLKHDASVNVRLAAVDVVRPFVERPEVRQAILEALVGQESPMVQIALIDMLVEIRDKRSVEALRQLSSDKNVNQTVRERADWGLTQLN